MLAELSTKEISEATDPDSFNEHINVAKQGGEIARNARLELEEKTGKQVVSPLKAKDGIVLKGHEEKQAPLVSFIQNERYFLLYQKICFICDGLEIGI
jgi:hypothetical protein